jgi:spermidine synthase
VEIDPVVYQAARQYFGLSDPGEGRVFLKDARAWVMDTQQNNTQTDKPSQFDIVVHDCFSGGGVPGHIFTVEFWEALKTLMSPDGVLVVVGCFSPAFGDVVQRQPAELCGSASVSVCTGYPGDT